MSALFESKLPLPVRRGKVRDVYDVGDVDGQPALLIVATDRISAFDVVMGDPIPDKGKILTALSLFWFGKFAGEYKNHLITTEVSKYPPRLAAFADQLRGRSMLVRKTEVIPIECVARGYLAGSGWKEYSQSKTVCGIPLPAGLRHCDPLPTPIFTPATKADSGHDLNISFEEMTTRIRTETAEYLRDRTLSLYTAAAEYARSRGMIIADTKFEFGRLDDGQIILIDEVLTPDSSRFWSADAYEPGHDQASFDKQFLRNWLESQPWDKSPPAPPLPPEIIVGTRRRYAEAYEKIVGTSLRIG
jgi:phosphoribosylaminoimidazole-succinocarboxamide synthase